MPLITVLAEFGDSRVVFCWRCGNMDEIFVGDKHVCGAAKEEPDGVQDISRKG